MRRQNISLSGWNLRFPFGESLLLLLEHVNYNILIQSCIWMDVWCRKLLERNRKDEWTQSTKAFHNISVEVFRSFSKLGKRLSLFTGFTKNGLCP